MDCKNFIMYGLIILVGLYLLKDKSYADLKSHSL